MAAETLRIEIPIRVEDNTNPGVAQATRKINAFDKTNQKTQERLDKMNRTRYQVILSALDRASSVIGAVSGKIRGIAGRTFSFSVKVLDYATAPLRSLWNFATSIQGAILGATGAFAGIYQPMQLAGAYEQTQVAFETMLGSAEKAEKFLQEAVKFAAQTPFEFPELVNSSKLLLAFGFNVENIMPMMQTIGDASAGLGAGAVGIDRITRALGQMQAKGRAQAEELLQLQELGVPANQILQEELGLTGEQVANIGKEGVEASKVIDALMRGMNKRFGGMMLNQSRTALGMISTLRDTLQTSLLRPWGEGLWAGIKPGLERLTKWIDENQHTIAEWGDMWKTAGNNITKWAMERVEDFKQTIRRMTSSQEWKDAQTFGEQIRVAWKQIIEQPFMDWWNTTGKAWLEEMSGKIGEGIGTALKTGILGLLGLEIQGVASEGKSIGASFAEGFIKGFDGAKVADAIKDALKGIFKDATTIMPGGAETSPTGWLSATILTYLGFKGAKGIGSLFKSGKGIYSTGKQLFKGGKAADAITDVSKLTGIGASADIKHTTGNLADAAKSFRSAADASKDAEKAVRNAEALKIAKQIDLENHARSLKNIKKEAAKFGDDIPKGLEKKIKTAEGIIKQGRIDIKKSSSYLDEMKHVKNVRTSDYLQAREGFVAAKDATKAAKAINKTADVVNKKGIVSRLSGILGKSGDDVLKVGKKGIRGIPLLGTLLGLMGSSAIIASAAPEQRGREVAGEAGGWAGAIGAGIGAGALVGTLGGGPIGTAIGSVVGGVGGAIGGEVFAEWLYAQKDVISNFFTKTLPKGWDTLWNGIGNFFSEQLPYGIGYAAGKIKIFFTEDLPSFIGNLLGGAGILIKETIPTAAASAVTGISTFFTSTLPGFITDLLIGVGILVKETIPTAAKSIGGGITTFFTESVPGFFTGLGGKIWGGISAGYAAATGSTPKHAYGGIMTKPHMGIVAENGAEGIIPLSPSKRRRGIDLWQKTGDLLGVHAYEDGGIVGDVSKTVPISTSTSKGGNPITIKVEVKAEPSFTIETGDGVDESRIVTVLRTYIREMADDIGDELAERLARIFANMPVKGGASA